MEKILKNKEEKWSKLISIIRNMKERVTKGLLLAFEIGVGIISIGFLIACLVLLYMNSKGGL